MTTARLGQPKGCVDDAFASFYSELRALAHARLGRGSGALLGTTSLLHESYLRCAKLRVVGADERRHFFAYAGQVMRSVIVDVARRRAASRRGSNAHHESLGEQPIRYAGVDEILKVNNALDQLQRLEPRITQVVQLRYFAGMTEAEIADAMGIAERTVKRDWQRARQLLFEMLHA